jgi:hypothetical protein
MKDFADRIPKELMPCPGRAFYSGRRAFSGTSDLYVIGVNPGGDSSTNGGETVERHTDAVLHTYDDDWSAYRDESWAGAKPGAYGMAPRLLHLFDSLDLNPGQTPSSNLVFVRSRRQHYIQREMNYFADLCWPFHELVIARLQPRVILCLGQAAGNYVRARIGANILCGEFVENNRRKWRSRAFVNPVGIKVVTATHPSIADWTNSSTDPSQLVRESLNRQSL